MTQVHMTTPCENCPYRVDAPRHYWDRAEFEGVLAAEQSYMGTIYSCHKQKDLPAAERGFCAGWLLDQKRRGVPSIALRIALIRRADAKQAFDTVTAGGVQLFATVNAMCRANGVRARQVRRRSPCGVTVPARLPGEES